MKVSTHAVARLLVLLLAAAALSQSKPDQQVSAETANAPAADQPPERFWIAGRYDGNRVIIYFDAVKFNGPVPPVAERLPKPVADGFLFPEKLPWAYVAKLQQGPDAEHFKMGDKYDLLLDCGMGCLKAATVTLTTMIGEGESYIGALATLDNDDDEFLLLKDYYVMRQHREKARVAGNPPNFLKIRAGMESEPGREPVRFDIQAQILDLLTERMQSTATEAERRAAQKVSPIFEVQSFRVADGSLRYYARAAWRWKEDPTSNYGLAAWVVAEPKLHIVAAEARAEWYDRLDDSFPSLLNVVDLGGGKTGIILSIPIVDGSSIRLVEYKDGLDFLDMPFLQSIESGQ